MDNKFIIDEEYYYLYVEEKYKNNKPTGKLEMDISTYSSMMDSWGEGNINDNKLYELYKFLDKFYKPLNG